MKKSLTLCLLWVFAIPLILASYGCKKKFDTTRELSLDCIKEKIDKIGSILDTARVGSDDYMFPQASVDELQATLEETKTGLSAAMAGHFVLQYEADNICLKAEQAMTRFLGSYNFTLPAGSDGQLLVNGLDQKGSIDFGDNPEYSASNTYTVELWVKYNKDFLDFEMATLVGTTSEGPDGPNKFEGWNIHYQRSGNLRASMGCGAGVLEQARAYPTNFGEWNHVALVWNINATAGAGEDRPYHMKMYVNGELFWQKNNDILSGGLPRPMLPSSRKKMRAFIDPYHPSRCMTGYMKKFRIWNEAKTQDQVKGLMMADVTGTEAGLLCAWDFLKVPADPSNVPDKTGRFTAKIQGSHKWMPL
ncbi:MAG: LamG-like jellyroll fold domain-containing protein [Pseudobacter sp.]|uniref:LamG-like jellyroll fold domain-containing protein n=1 Tax=Pseudobacter sp. TaxID=2045420 RepID=UPI003F7F180B